MLKIPLLLFHFSMEVSIQSIKYWMVISGIDVGRRAFKPHHSFSSLSLLNACIPIDYLRHQWIYISKLAPPHLLTTVFIHDCIFFLALSTSFYFFAEITLAEMFFFSIRNIECNHSVKTIYLSIV